jgi:hypothetical protein
MLSRLNADWQERWGHPVAVAETFVDPVLYQGTCYKVSGWMRVAETAGYARSAKGDLYQAHKSPKHLWVKELEKGACQKLRGSTLPEAWAGVEALYGWEAFARQPRATRSRQPASYWRKST